VFVVGGVRIDGVRCWRFKDRGWMMIVVEGVRMDGVCCLMCKDRWCLVFEV